MDALNFLRCALKIQFNEHLRDTLGRPGAASRLGTRRDETERGEGHRPAAAAARKRELRLRIRNVSSQKASKAAKKGCHKHILFNVIAFLRSAAFLLLLLLLLMMMLPSKTLASTH